MISLNNPTMILFNNPTMNYNFPTIEENYDFVDDTSYIMLDQQQNFTLSTDFNQITDSLQYIPPFQPTSATSFSNSTNLGILPQDYQLQPNFFEFSFNCLYDIQPLVGQGSDVQSPLLLLPQQQQEEQQERQQQKQQHTFKAKILKPVTNIKQFKVYTPSAPPTEHQKVIRVLKACQSCHLTKRRCSNSWPCLRCSQNHKRCIPPTEVKKKKKNFKAVEPRNNHKDHKSVR